MLRKCNLPLSRIRITTRSLSSIASTSSVPATRSFRPVKKSGESNLHVLSRQFSSTPSPLKPFLLADIGEGIVEVEIVKWLVSAGQTIEEFDPIVEVMSDKATVEITSPFSGKILSLGGKEGELVRVGGELCDVEIHQEHAEEADPVYTPSSIPASIPAIFESAPPIEVVEIIAPIISIPVEREGILVHATPATRRLAKENGIKLADVLGTGREGRVTKSDIMDFISRPPSILPPASPLLSSVVESPVAATSSSSLESITTLPLPPIRRAMMKAMTSTLLIPHFSYSDTIDVTLLERTRILLNLAIPLHYRKTLTASEEVELDRIVAFGGNARVGEEKRIARITLVSLLIKSLSQALETNRLFLSTLSPTLDSLLVRRSHDISIALSPQNGGLFTPLLAGVESLSPFDLASKISHLQAISTLSSPPKFPTEYKGTGSITVSNVGVIGGRFTTPIIPPTGQLAIVALGRTRVIPKYSNESISLAKSIALGGEGKVEELKLVPRLMLDVSFSGDHRVVEGVELAKLGEEFKRIVEGRLVGI